MTRQKASRNSTQQSSQPTRLAGKLDKNLVTYALAASAAGVGLMALTQSAEAKVVATSAHIVVPINGGVIQFDVNGDGIPDFGLSAGEFVDTSCCAVHPKGRPPLGGIAGGHLKVIPAQPANEVAVIEETAAALPPDVQIGAGRHFEAGSIMMAGIIVTGCGGSSDAYGNWKGTHPPHAYLPIKFSDTSANVHYGWVRISCTETGAIDFNATIDGFAYETVPNKPIVSGAISGPVSGASLLAPAESLGLHVPPAASLGILALGAPGLTAWRKQDESEEKVV
jgi:hypothetical protein